MASVSSKNNTSFQERVIAVVKSIPRGKVMSYAEVARLAGSPRAHRAVGSLMSHNDDPSIPCHRVIRSDGDPGGYNGLRGEKIRLLRAEGVKI